MFKVLVSACLMGETVRYDGKAHTSGHHILAQWANEGRLVLICPEVSGGLGVPRPPAEIRDSQSGAAVLDHRAHVFAKTGEDVTQPFLVGAQAALDLARKEGAVLAVLTERSPSCGSTTTYDGKFNGSLIAGEGVTTALLRREGLAVFSQNQLPEALAWLQAREAEDVRQAEA